MVALSPSLACRPVLGLAFAWSGFAVMWGFWVSFVIFLAEPRHVLDFWPLPTVDRGGWVDEPWTAAIVDVCLIALFGLQHSVMARPWFKEQVMRMPAPFVRCTYVHMANAALFALIVLWQPIPLEVWHASEQSLQTLIWALFAAGWIVLLLGAWSFGMRELLGLRQMQAWVDDRRSPEPGLKTGWLYRRLRHPMYIGVLLGIWATPRMSLGHLLLASGLTAYVLIAVRYEERDLLQAFGARYRSWRQATY